jgi:multimeric flavodoxin WrbA
MAMKVLFLNCTLKKSPMISNTCALIDKAEAIFKEHGVESEVIRIVDNVAFGVSSDERGGDEWPLILEKITACDIPIIAFSIWFRVRSSVTRMVIERLDGRTYIGRKPQTGQYALYGKVAGVIVTGNEDGARNVAGTTLFNLNHLGCTVLPKADCYWVGDASPGPSYIQAGGDRYLYTNRTAGYMVDNLVYLAKLLKENSIPVNLKKLDKGAKKVSD